MGFRAPPLSPIDRRRLRRGLLWWLWVSPERRFYSAALGMGLFLLVWAGLTALGAQGRLPPAPEWRLPSFLDISLPGRPVMVPVVAAGINTTAWGMAIPGSWLEVWNGSELMAKTFMPSEMTGRRMRLRVTGDLPRVIAPSPAMRGFRPLRLFEVEMEDADSGERMDWRGQEVEVHVAVRQVDLDRVRGDASRLLLLHWDTEPQHWENMGAVVRDGFVVARTWSLSPFALGYVEDDGVAPVPAPVPTAAPILIGAPRGAGRGTGTFARGGADGGGAGPRAR